CSFIRSAGSFVALQAALKRNLFLVVDRCRGQLMLSSALPSCSAPEVGISLPAVLLPVPHRWEQRSPFPPVPVWQDRADPFQAGDFCLEEGTQVIYFFHSPPPHTFCNFSM
uniref:Uncharacterized protein n=1 Tax=Taeniopygia guttata TaxID=59729 RepID=A0A674HUK5_TAEGU